MITNIDETHLFLLKMKTSASEGPPVRDERPRREEAAAPPIVDAISDTNTIMVIGILALIAWVAEYLKVFQCSC